MESDAARQPRRCRIPRFGDRDRPGIWGLARNCAARLRSVGDGWVAPYRGHKQNRPNQQGQRNRATIHAVSGLRGRLHGCRFAAHPRVLWPAAVRNRRRPLGGGLPVLGLLGASLDKVTTVRREGLAGGHVPGHIGQPAGRGPGRPRSRSNAVWASIRSRPISTPLACSISHRCSSAAFLRSGR
jgi:hypothetical protein